MAVCETCGQEHIARYGGPSCTGHVTRERADENGYRAPLPAPRPCAKDRMHGQSVCASHGGTASQNRTAGERRVTEQKIATAARKLIPDVADRTQIVNPLETLLDLASEANAFRESLRIMANELDGKIRYAASGGTGEQLRAEVATYRQALKDTTDLLVAIARLDIEKMLARIESRKVDMTLDAMNHGCDDAGLDETQKRMVMAGVARHLRSVRRVA